MPVWAAVKREIRVAAPAVLLVFGTLYGGLCLLFWKYEPAFVFAQVPRPAVAPDAAGLKGFTQVTVTAEEGVTLFGWWRAPDPGHGAIVLLTGTGVTLQDYAGLLGDLAAHGFGILGIDY